MLVLPKHVVIQNPGLNRIYYATTFLTFSVLVMRFAYYKQYLRQYDVSEGLHVTLWSSKSNYGPSAMPQLQKAWEAKATNKLCASPQTFDYWWSANFKYENHTCLPMCGTKVAGGVVDYVYNPEQMSCLHHFLSQRQERADQVLLTTRIATERVEPDGTVVPLHSYFVPSVEAMSVSFTFAWSVPRAKWYDGSEDVARKQDMVRGHSRHGGNILAVVLDHDKNIYRKVRPSSEPITLTVPEILDLAGAHSDLDTPQSDLGINFKPGAAIQDGPIGRISGLTFNLNLDCYERGQMGEDWKGEVCYVVFERDALWAERKEFRLEAGTSRRWNYAGIRIKTVTRGHMAVFDPNSILLNIVAVLVFLKYPKKIVQFIATRALGNLSSIYRRVIYERFHIGEAISGMAARLLTHFSAYEALENQNGSNGISKMLLRNRLGAMIEFRAKLHGETGADNTIDALTDFAWLSLNHPQWFDDHKDSSRFFKFIVRHPFINKIVTKVTNVIDFFIDDGVESANVHKSFRNRILTRADQREPSGIIDRDEYLSACALSEPVGYFTLSNLFTSSNENKYSLENLFMPPYLMKSHFMGLSDQVRDLRTPEEANDECGTQPALEQKMAAELEAMLRQAEARCDDIVQKQCLAAIERFSKSLEASKTEGHEAVSAAISSANANASMPDEGEAARSGYQGEKGIAHRIEPLEQASTDWLQFSAASDDQAKRDVHDKLAAEQQQLREMLDDLHVSHSRHVKHMEALYQELFFKLADLQAWKKSCVFRARDAKLQV